MPFEAACTGVAVIRERPEAFVASYASSTSEFDGDVGEEGCVCVWSLASTKAPDSQFRCEAGITSIACDPRHPSLVLGGAASGQPSCLMVERRLVSVDHPWTATRPSFIIDLRFICARRRYGIDGSKAARLLSVGAGKT